MISAPNSIVNQLLQLLLMLYVCELTSNQKKMM